VSSMAASGIDIVFAAGNCGPACADMRCQSRTLGAIMGANAHPDVLTLAGCDTNDQIVGYSSQGPSIANMFPQKPDITTYTHFLGSQAFGAGSPDSGTSASCPVAAGCVAAIRTKVAPSSTPPVNLFAQIKATARHVGTQPGWQNDFGHGIMDPDAAAVSLGVWGSMGNPAFMTVHGIDGPPTLESAAQELGVAVDDIDPDFGVVLIDQTRGLYTVQVHADHIPEQLERESYQGPFSNPRIDTFRVLPSTSKKDK